MAIVIHEDYRFQALINQLEAYWDEKDEENFRQSLAVLQRLAEEEQDPAGLAATYFYQGIFQRVCQDCKGEAKVYLRKAQTISKSHNIPFYLMKSENELGRSFLSEADFYSSLKHYLKAFHIAQEHQEFQYDGIVLNNIGNLFVWLGEFESAVYYLEQAYTMYAFYEQEDQLFLSELIITIIEVYSAMGDFAQAEQWREIGGKNLGSDQARVLECIFLMNEAKIALDSGEDVWAQEKIRQVLECEKTPANYICFFRGLLRAFQLSIKMDVYDLATEVMCEMDRLRSLYSLDNFSYVYAELKVEYLKQFQQEHNLEQYEYLDFYYNQGRQKIKQLSATYTRSLFAEIELDRSKYEQTSMMKENEKLQQDIERDTFTNLYNKVSTEKYVTEALSYGSDGGYLVMLLIDIDKFKSVNDLYGHDFGDHIIVQSARLLEQIPIEDKIVGRFGGDEFLVFFPKIKQADQVYNVVNDLLKKVHTLELPDNRIEKITFSIGICFSKGGDSFEQVFKSSDQALYQAKEQGRDRYAIYMDV